MAAPVCRSCSPRRHFALQSVACAVTLACWELGLANPTAPQVAAGSASFQSSGSTLTVTNSPRAIINWGGFSIGSGELTRFQQQSAASAVLNRVVGGNPSSILGTLSSNGRVFLVNPSGIVVGAGAMIDTAGFIASTLNITDHNFLQGKLSFEGGGQGALRNAGTIRASGDIFLVGPTIENTGAIRSDGGSVVLAAGKSVTISSPDAHGVTFTLQAPTDSVVNIGAIEATNAVGMFAGTLRHSGDISVVGAGVDGAGRVVLAAQKDVTIDSGATITANGAAGGRVQISAESGLADVGGEVQAVGSRAAGGSISVSAPVVAQTGNLRADGATGGAVAVRARNLLQAGAVTADGRAGPGGMVSAVADKIIQTFSALFSAKGNGGAGGNVNVSAGQGSKQGIFSSAEMSATGAGAAGGRITVTGNEVILRAARLDASGDTGGGTVLIGGDWQGKNPAVPNAQKTQVNFSTTIKADARETGHGGTVVVWSDKTTQFGGTIFARGGARSGDGGRVEVSGKETLVFGGMVDAAAPNGRAGTLLLDPGGILIDAAGGGQSAIDLVDPNIGGSDSFGGGAVVLTNGNVVAVEPEDDFGGSTSTGAVHLFNGATGALISTIVGAQDNDQVGSGGATALTNGNFVVRSSNWNGAVTNAGAVTWGSGTSGVSGVVSPANSLVGSTANDFVGDSGVTALPSGNYVVASVIWDNGTVSNVGAVTFGNGTTGIVGPVTSTNSLVGSVASDLVGIGGVTALTNGNYVVNSRLWNNGAVLQVGAVTFGNGTSGISGAVSATNSLVGTTANDFVGVGEVTALNNGNYVVRSPNWANGGNANAGAVTWGSGTSGVSGVVDQTNSLVGSILNDQVGSGGVVALAIHPTNNPNGNYVVISPEWDNTMPVPQAGAVTLASGTGGTVGAVSAANSLVGATNDRVGSGGVTALTNGHYVVASPLWNLPVGATQVGAATWRAGTNFAGVTVAVGNSITGATASDQVSSGGITALTNGNFVVSSPEWVGVNPRAGAVTWGNGANGTFGAVNATNSLVGAGLDDAVGIGGVTALPSGNYVVRSQNWTDLFGAVTFADGSIAGTTGRTGAVSAANSLVGSLTNDQVGLTGVTVLTNGNYVVGSHLWNNTPAGATEAGAVTWGSGTSGVSGLVSATNSLMGTTTGDRVGAGGVRALTNDNYVAISPQWNNGAATATLAGAVTWANGATGITGAVSATNSLVGTTANDFVGSGGVTALSNGNYVVRSPNWGSSVDLLQVGAVTWGSGTTGVSGAVSAANSILGATAFDQLGSDGVTQIAGNRVLVRSGGFDNGGIVDAGRLQIYDGSGGTFTNPLTFSDDASGPATITPMAITAITNAGTAVTLQANTDITLAAGSNIVTSAAGAGGSLTMQAGRSIFLNSNIFTDNGNLTLVANETLANGVVTANRAPGAATIAMAAGTSFNAGSGLLSMTIANGAGRTGTQALGGDLMSGAGVNLTGGRITLQNNGGGGIVLGTGMFQANATGLANTTPAITIAAPGTGALISSNANLTTVSGGVSVSANGFIELDPASVGSVINAAGNADITSTTSSISAFGVTPTTAFMDVAGAAVTLTAGTFVNLGTVANHGLRARTGDVTVSAGTSFGAAVAGAMRGPIVSDNGNVNIRLLGLGAAGTSFFDYGDGISAPNGSITIDNGSGARINASINVAGASPFTAGGNITLKATNFLDLGPGATAGGNLTLDTGADLFVRSGAAAGAAGTLTLNAQKDITIDGMLQGGSINATTLDTTGTMTVNRIVTAGNAMNLNLAGGLVVQSSAGQNAQLIAQTGQTITARSIAVAAFSGSTASIDNNTNGSQTITVNNAGAGTGIDVANHTAGIARIQHFGGLQTITVNDGARLHVNAIGGNAEIVSTNGDQTILVQGAGANAIEVGTATNIGRALISGNNQLITAGTGTQSGAIRVRAGVTEAVPALIQGASGTQNVSTTGSLTIAGGTAGGPTGAQGQVINIGTGMQLVSANGIDMTGGASGSGNNAVLQNVATSVGQQITVGSGGLAMTGGSGGSNNSALLQQLGATGTQTVTINAGGSIELEGGSGSGAQNQAQLSAAGTSQQINFGAGGNIELTGGTNGTLNIARIRTTAAGSSQNITGATGITLTGGASGGGFVTTPSFSTRGNFAQIRGAGNQTVFVGAGGITMTGGGGTLTDNFASLSQADTAAGAQQTITVQHGGAITVTGGSSAATSSGEDGSGSFAFIRGDGGAGQTINFMAGGAINVTGGTIGTGNSAGLRALTGQQTISGAPTISLIAGASGGIANDGNGATIFADVGTQDISAAGMSLTGSAGAVGSASTIRARNQNILVNGNLSLTGSSGGTGASGSRIGALTDQAMDLALTVRGNLTLNGGAATDSGSAIGPSSANMTAQTSNIAINADGDVTLNGGTGTGTRIGHPADLVGGGTIAVTAGGNIALSGNGTSSGNIRTTGNATLRAESAGKTITQATNSSIFANLLTASANGQINLPGTNKVQAVNLGTAGGNIAFNNAQSLTFGPSTLSTPAGAQTVAITTTGTTSDITFAGNFASDDNFSFTSGRDVVVAGGTTFGASSATLFGAGSVQFPSGTVTLNAPVTANLPVNIAGATVNLNGTATANNGLTLSSGALQGSGAATVAAGTFAWSGGSVAGAGALTTNATTNITAPVTLHTRTWNNAGTVNQTGASRLTLQGTAVIDNNGIWNLSSTDTSPLAGGRFNNANTFNNDGTTAHTITTDFNNTGLLRINAGSLTLQVAGAANNPGLIDIAADAALAVSGTSVTNDGFVFLGERAMLTTSGGPVTNNNTTLLAADARLMTSGQPVTNTGVLSFGVGAVIATGGADVTNTSTGTLRGSGTLSLGGGMLVNNGTLTPGASPGTMMVDGNFTQGPGGILAIDVAGPNPGVDYDVLRVSGAANLAGALHIIQSGAYVPPDGQTFDFLAYGSRSGDFQTFVFPPGFTFRPMLGPTSYGVAAVSSGSPMGAAMMAELTATSSNQVVVLSNTSSERATESESNSETTANTGSQAESEQKPRTAAKDCR